MVELPFLFSHYNAVKTFVKVIGIMSGKQHIQIFPMPNHSETWQTFFMNEGMPPDLRNQAIFSVILPSYTVELQDSEDNVINCCNNTLW